MPLMDNYVQTPGMPPGVPVLNSGRHGLSPLTLPGSNWWRLRQPYLDRFGRACVTIHDVAGGMTRNDSRGGEAKPLLRNYLIQDLANRGYPVPLMANAATLRKEEWIEMDRVNVLAYRERLQLAADLRNRVPYGGFDGYSRMTIEYQAMSDAGTAYVDMDAQTDGTTDTPLWIIRSLPLPITHSDYGYSDRELAVSGSAGTPFDTIMGEMASRRVGETVEDQCIGNVTGVTYGTITAGPGIHTGTSTVYGMRTFPQRLTKTNFTAPTTGGWSPATLTNEILAALNQLRGQRSYGPWTVYHSTDWDNYLDSDYYAGSGSAVAPTITLRDRLLRIPDLSGGIKRLDRLTTAYTMLFVPMDPQVVQLVVGMDVRTVQWAEKGGLAHRYKVMCIIVPRFRSDYYSRTGILHGTTS